MYQLYFLFVETIVYNLFIGVEAVTAHGVRKIIATVIIEKRKLEREGGGEGLVGSKDIKIRIPSS